MPRPRRIYVGYRCPECGGRMRPVYDGERLRCTRWGCYFTQLIRPEEIRHAEH